MFRLDAQTCSRAAVRSVYICQTPTGSKMSLPDVGGLCRWPDQLVVGWA